MKRLLNNNRVSLPRATRRIVFVAGPGTEILDLVGPLQVFSALHRFAESGEGDVKALQGRDELRLRIGDYRLLTEYFRNATLSLLI